MTDITVPGEAVAGNPGHIPDHNEIYDALTSLQAQVTAIAGGAIYTKAEVDALLATRDDRLDGHDTDIADLQARPTFEASATEPAHDGHQRVGALWIVKTA